MQVVQKTLGGRSLLEYKALPSGEEQKQGPTVVMVVGVNGAGKDHHSGQAGVEAPQPGSQGGGRGL